MKIKSFRVLAAVAIIAIVSVALVACGSKDADVVAQDAAAPVVAPAVSAVDTTEPAESKDAQASVTESADKTMETSASLEPTGSAPLNRARHGRIQAYLLW